MPQPVSASPDEKALSFDGVDDLITVPAASSLYSSNYVTIEMWINPTDAGEGGYGQFWWKQGTGGTNAYMNNGPRIRMGLKIDGNFETVLTAWGTVPYGSWSHIVMVYDGANLLGYINAGTPASTPATGPIDDHSGDDLALGARAYGANNFHGLIDEVRIYNRAITADEIAYNYNGGAGRATPQSTEGLVAWWHMDEGTGGTIFDETANDNDGTLMPDYPGGNYPIWVDGFPFPAEAPAVISKIVFTTPPQTVLINQASEAMTIQTQGASDKSVSVAEDTTINLTSTPGGGEFSLSDTSWDPVPWLVIPTGANSATFYYKQGAMGNPTITAYEVPDAEWTDAQQVVTFQGPVQLWRAGELIGTYDTIQEAIDAAEDGDDIIVLPETYDGQIVIYKQITVKSQDGAATTIIDAQQGKDIAWEMGPGMAMYPAVWIQRDGVVFGDAGQGFTIRNTAPMVFPEGEEDPNEYGVAILADAPGCIIEDNVIEDSNPVGIFAFGDTTTISGNAVSASIAGILTLGGGGGEGGSTITGNTVSSTLMFDIYSQSPGSVISGNTVSDNFMGSAIRVEGDDNQITNNTLLDNQGAAISLEHVNNATVSGNSISAATTSIADIYGIDVQGGNNNDISGNAISDVLVGGITLNNTSDNSLSANNVSNIDGYNLGGDNDGFAEWTREQVRFERLSVKLETGPSTEPLGVAKLEIPFNYPFQYFEMGGELYFWAYLLDEYGYGSREYWLDHEALLPTYRLELDNGVILEAGTGYEDLVANEWLKLFAVGDWTWTNADPSEEGVVKDISTWIGDFSGARVVKLSVVYSGAANKTVYIDGSQQEGIPIEPPTGIVIGRSNRNSISGSIISYVNGAGILIVESRENMIGDNNTIFENMTGIFIDNSNGNTVRDSTISDNYRGIIILRSHNNQIIGNDITGNTQGMSGVHLDGESDGNEIHANNIVGNTPRDIDGNIISFGVFKESGDWVNASGNWWGDASEPYHEERNPEGTGNAVSEFVHFEPWVYPDALPEGIAPTIVDNLAMPEMTAVLGMAMGDVGPEQTTLVVEAWDDEGGVGIARVTVDLGALLLQMLPYPIVIRLRTDNPPFNDIRVRQAMSMAIDYDTLRSELGGYGNIVLNPEEGLPTDYNPEMAAVLLIDAGYPDGFQTEIIMHWQYADLAGMLMGYWADIGVVCETRVVDMWELISRIIQYGIRTDGLLPLWLGNDTMG